MSEQYRDQLLQEILIEQDPTGWRLLVGCVLLNRTSRTQVEKVWPRLFELYPMAENMALIGPDPRILKPLGLWNTRSATLSKMAKWWVATPPLRRRDDVLSCRAPGVGPYARDSWTIFVEKRVPVDPVTDTELRIFLESDRAPR